MRKRHVIYLASVLGLAAARGLDADQSARVTEAVNQVGHGATDSATSPATAGTLVHDGEYVRTGVKSRAALELANQSVTRLGSYTIFNYSVESNTVDLQAGTILFCKPPDAPRLNIKTQAVTAGITGTTGFVSVHSAKGNQKVYILGIIEGHTTAWADGHPFPVGPGDILEFNPATKPFIFAFDVPRFVKSSSLLTKFNGHLPNQSAIDRELASYQDDVSRGFIQPPSKAIDYSSDIPVLSLPAYDSASNSEGRSKGPPPTPPPPSSTQSYPGRGQSGGSSNNY